MFELTINHVLDQFRSLTGKNIAQEYLKDSTDKSLEANLDDIKNAVETKLGRRSTRVSHQGDTLVISSIKSTHLIYNTSTHKVLFGSLRKLGLSKDYLRAVFSN